MLINPVSYIFEFKLLDDYWNRECCVQYDETDYDYIHRLLAEDGTSYYFEHTKDSHTMYMVNDVSFARPADQIEYNANPATGERPDACLTRFTYQERMHTTKQTQRDYTFLNPRYNLQHVHHCKARFIPSDKPWRPEPVMKPLMHGPQTAHVVGPSGEDIYCDEWGRVKIQFPWDREGQNNEFSSCWVRVSQAWAGAMFGNIDSKYPSSVLASPGSSVSQYSTGYFLMRHILEYPVGNIITFYSLYCHTAKLDDYDESAELKNYAAEYKNQTVNLKNKAQPSATIVALDRFVPILGNKVPVSDQEVVLNPPIPVRAGQKLGKPGRFEQLLRMTKSSPEKMIQLEVFTYDDIRQFSSKAIQASTQIEKKIEVFRTVPGPDGAGATLRKNEKTSNGKQPPGIKISSLKDEDGNALKDADGNELQSVKGHPCDLPPGQFITLEGTSLKSASKRKVVTKINGITLDSDSQGTIHFSEYDIELVFETPKPALGIHTQFPLLIPVNELPPSEKDKNGKAWFNISDWFKISSTQNTMADYKYVSEDFLVRGQGMEWLTDIFTGGEGDRLGVFTNTVDTHDASSSNSRVEKEKLNDLFKDIMQHLNIDQNRDGYLDKKEIFQNTPGASYEAGILAQLLRKPEYIHKTLHMAVKHSNEWRKNNAADANLLLDTLKNQKSITEQQAQNHKKRLEDLQIKVKTRGFDADKPAYFVQPFGLIFGLNDRKWHDPLDTPMCTIFTQSQINGKFNAPGKRWGLFGTVRNGSTHTGLDLFATTGTNIYACVDGTVYDRRRYGGYGNTITIKVKDTAVFLQLKLDYKLKYKNNGEMAEGSLWSEKGDIYLFYAHLDSVNKYTCGQEVRCGEILGTTGRSGVGGGTCAPHLHFEIFCNYEFEGHIRYCINPAFFVQYQSYENQSANERKKQQDEAKKGKIKEVDGTTKLIKAPMQGFKK